MLIILSLGFRDSGFRGTERLCFKEKLGKQVRLLYCALYLEVSREWLASVLSLLEASGRLPMNLEPKFSSLP